MKSRIHTICCYLIVIASSNAADIFSWRMDGNGRYPEAQAPLDWKDESKLIWQTELAQRSNASPILVAGRLYFTAEPATLICVDAASGKILWEHGNEYQDLAKIGPEQQAKMDQERLRGAAIKEEIAPLERALYRAERRLKRSKGKDDLKKVEELKQKLAELKGEMGEDAQLMAVPPTHNVNGYASYTPVSDGRHVWACFGIGVVVCYDLDGRRLWSKRTAAPDHNWGGACSPSLVGGKLIVRFKDYLALDPATGDEFWRLPSEGVLFNAPAHFELGGKHYLISARGELIRVADGKKLPSSGFEVEAKPWCFMNTPSVIGRLVYFAHGCEGQQGDAYCLEIPASNRHLESDGLKPIWHQKIDKNRYYSSPLVDAGLVYLISREYVLQVLDARTGKPYYEQKVKGFTGTAYPSLSLVGDAVFVGAEDGNAAFLKPGKKYQEIARTKVDPYRSTPIFIGNVCYLRTQESLKAIRAE